MRAVRQVAMLAVAVVAIGCTLSMAAPSFPVYPFQRKLQADQPAMTGKDVTILQNLLLRAPSTPFATTSGRYDQDTVKNVAAFQVSPWPARLSRSAPCRPPLDCVCTCSRSLYVTPTNRAALSPAQEASKLGRRDGVFDAETAQAVLDALSADGYRDNGFPASKYGKKYKVQITVHRNRSVETKAKLFNANNDHLFSVSVRAPLASCRPCHYSPAPHPTPSGLSSFFRPRPSSSASALTGTPSSAPRPGPSTSTTSGSTSSPATAPRPRGS